MLPMRAARQAAKHCHGEALSRAEILRGYTLAGIHMLGKASADDQAQLAYTFQSKMPAVDTRLRD